MGEKYGFDKPGFGFKKPKTVQERSPWPAHFVAMTGEFVGTFMFLLIAFLGHEMAVARQAGPAPSGPNGGNANNTIIYISLSYGFSLLVSAWTFYRISGGLFNPAVTAGLVVSGALPPMRGLLLVPPQILGAICAAAVTSGIVPEDIAMVQTTLASGVSVAQGVFLEMFLTAELVFTILMLAGEKHKGTFIAPVGIGLALFVAEIAGVYYTGASLNPARSFGPCVVAGNFQGYHWIYWVGPFLGAMISGGYYHFVKFFNYEDANPGQDSAGGDFDEDEMSRSGSRANTGDMGGRMERGDSRLENGRGQVFASRDGANGRASYSQHNSHQDRPQLNQRIESGTLHPGFNNY